MYFNHGPWIGTSDCLALRLSIPWIDIIYISVSLLRSKASVFYGSAGRENKFNKGSRKKSSWFNGPTTKALTHPNIKVAVAIIVHVRVTRRDM